MCASRFGQAICRLSADSFAGNTSDSSLFCECRCCKSSSNSFVDVRVSKRRIQARLRSVKLGENMKIILEELCASSKSGKVGVSLCEDCYQLMFNTRSAQALPREKMFEPPSEIVDGKIYLGSYYSAIDRNWMMTNNINKVIVCAPNLPLIFHDDSSIKYLRIPIEDTGECNIIEYVPQCIAFINSEGPILIHCRAGVSRSASIVIAWMMIDHKIDYEAALSIVKSRRNIVSPNWSFELQLKSFGQSLYPAAAKPS